MENILRPYIEDESFSYHLDPGASQQQPPRRPLSEPTLLAATATTLPRCPRPYIEDES